MNSILKRFGFELTGKIVQKRKIKFPVTMSFDKDGVCLGMGKVKGAKTLNIKHRNGKVTVVHL